MIRNLKNFQDGDEIQDGVGNQDGVFVLYKGEGETFVSKATKPQISINESPVKRNDLDLTGSPLKCSFDLGNDIQAETEAETEFVVKKGLIPLNSDDARRFLSALNAYKEHFECWTLIEEGNLLYIVSSVSAAEAETELMVKTSDVRFSGPHDAKSDEIRFEKILKKHAEKLPKAELKRNSASAIYNFSSSDVEDSSQVRVRLDWERPMFVLENPSPSSTASVSIKVNPGDVKMATFGLYEELESLRGFSRGLFDSEVVWRGRNDDEDDLGEKLLELVEAVKRMGPRGIRIHNVEDATDDEAGEADVILGESGRKDVDFTDMIWTVLHKVDSYAKLTFYLTQIINIIKSEQLRPFVSHTGCPINIESPCT